MVSEDKYDRGQVENTWAVAVLSMRIRNGNVETYQHLFVFTVDAHVSYEIVCIMAQKRATQTHHMFDGWFDQITTAVMV